MQTTVALEMAVRVLKRAREMISKPECWTKRAYARDEDGSNLMHVHALTPDVAERIVTDESAVCWCPDGAIRKALAEVRSENRFRPIEWEVIQAHARMGLWDAFVALDFPKPSPLSPSGRPTMWDWNDDVAMTHDVVLDAFDMAIEAKESAA